MSLPSYELELRASEERKRIHLSLNELKGRLRERAAFKPVLRKFLTGIAGSAALVGLMAGYGVGGFFSAGRR
ncbi:MAG TPA: hypothetical protein VGG46_02980 [Terriglobales bacterium]|jgi:hypothetical protein